MKKPRKTFPKPAVQHRPPHRQKVKTFKLPYQRERLNWPELLQHVRD